MNKIVYLVVLVFGIIISVYALVYLAQALFPIVAALIGLMFGIWFIVRAWEYLTGGE